MGLQESCGPLNCVQIELDCEDGATSARTWQGGHRQRVLLINRVQAISAHGVSDELELLQQRLAAVGHTDVRDVGAADVVALGAFFIVRRPQPVTFHLDVEEASARRHCTCELCIPAYLLYIYQAMHIFTFCEKPLMRTLFLASSHISQELSFHT